MPERGFRGGRRPWCWQELISPGKQREDLPHQEQPASGEITGEWNLCVARGQLKWLWTISSPGKFKQPALVETTGGIKLMKGKTLKKQISLQGKTAASVLLKLFISGKDATPLTPPSAFMSGTLFSKVPCHSWSSYIIVNEDSFSCKFGSYIQLQKKEYLIPNLDRYPTLLALCCVVPLVFLFLSIFWKNSYIVNVPYNRN